MGEFRFVGVDALERLAITALKLGVTRSLGELKAKVHAVTPVDDSDLINSERITKAAVRGRVVSGNMIAGGRKGLAHAVIVHQVEEIHHEHGQAKYVEAPLIQHAPRHREILAEAGRGIFK